MILNYSFRTQNISGIVCVLTTKKGMERDHGKWKRSLLIKADIIKDNFNVSGQRVAQNMS